MGTLKGQDIAQLNNEVIVLTDADGKVYNMKKNDLANALSDRLINLMTSHLNLSNLIPTRMNQRKGYHCLGTLPVDTPKEGVERCISMVISGFNNYIHPACLFFFSTVIHRGSLRSYVKTLFKPLNIADNELPSFGYVNQGDKIEFWVKAYSYPHYGHFLYFNKANFTISNTNQDTEPTGWTDILII